MTVPADESADHSADHSAPATADGLPSALDAPAVARRLDGRRPAVFLDYDGFLTPIVPHLTGQGLRLPGTRPPCLVSLCLMPGFRPGRDRRTPGKHAPQTLGTHLPCVNDRHAASLVAGSEVLG